MADKAYTTEEKIGEFLNVTIASGDVDNFILSAQQYIDEYTGRNFKADDAATARLYNGDDTQALIIDDAVDITKVEVGNDAHGSSFTEVLATGANRYFKEPENYDVKLVPVTLLRLLSSVFAIGLQNNRVTAKWGYSVAVPDDISFAATVLAAGMYNYSRGGGGDVKSEKIGNYSVAYDVDGNNSLGDYEQAIGILDRYKKLRI